MSIKILTAEKKHLSDIHSLLRELAEYQHLTSDFKISIDRLSELIFDEKSVNALVAECDGTVAGIALYYTSGVSTFSGNHILYLEDIYIKDSARRNGIGRELFNRLRAIAKKENCCKIEWKCQSWNVNAGSFYKIMGSKQEDGWTSFSINHI